MAKDLSQRIESEQLRLQERAQIAHLQGQLDELRHRLEQQAARVQLASEQARQVQELFAQVESKFEAQVGEARHQEQTRLRAYQALQKEVAELRVRVEEPARQILTMMAQLQDLQEGLRALREQMGAAREETKQLAQRVEELHAQGLLNEERLVRLDSQVGQLLQAEDERQQAVRQIRGEMEVERQSVRRQAAEVERLASDLRGEQQEFLARLNRLAELQRKVDATLQSFDERMTAQDAQFDRYAAELQRIEREAVERSLQGQERLENLRQSVQREWEELRVAEERRGESQNAWLRRIEELYHGLEQRLVRRDEATSQALVRLEARLQALEKGGEELLHALMEAFQNLLQEGATGRLQQLEPPTEG